MIKNYEDLPKDYKDANGLSFRDTELSKKEVVQWFGSGVDARTANTMLRILHGRRVAGTLDEPAFADHGGTYEKIKQDALAWLRKNVPVDEIENAGLRAEAELAAMGEELIDDSQGLYLYQPNSKAEDLIKRGESLGLYRPNSRANPKPTLNPKTWHPNSQPTYQSDGWLDNVIRVREEEAKRRQEAETKKLEARQAQADEILEINGGLSVADLRSKVEVEEYKEHPWLTYYIERAEKVAPKEVPTMSATRRLLPSGLFALVTVICCIAYAATYTPPTHRLAPDVPPAAATVMAIITINAIFLLAWRIPPLWAFMNKYMLVVPGYPRAAAILGNVFSHQHPFHYFANMISLWLFGSRLCDQIGRGDFLAIYLSAGVVGAFFSMTSYVARGIYTTSHLGASGAVSAVISAVCWINMEQKWDWSWLRSWLPDGWLPDGWLPPLPKYTSLLVLGAMMMGEVTALLRARKKGIVPLVDHINHLGGFFTGIVGGEITRRRIMDRRRQAHGILMMKET